MPTLFSLAFMHSTFTCMKKKSQKDGIVHLNMISKCNHRALKALRPEEAACSDCEHIQDACEPPPGAPSPLDIAPAGKTTFAMGQCATCNANVQWEL